MNLSDYRLAMRDVLEAVKKAKEREVKDTESSISLTEYKVFSKHDIIERETAQIRLELREAIKRYDQWEINLEREWRDERNQRLCPKCWLERGVMAPLDYRTGPEGYICHVDRCGYFWEAPGDERPKFKTPSYHGR